MGKKFVLSKGVFDRLLQHIVDFEEESKQMLDEVIQGPNAEKKRYEDLFKQYLHRLDALVRNAQVNETEQNQLPFVTIGSEVKLRNLDNNREQTLRIISPLQEKQQERTVPRATYLSPMGQALFLREKGDQIEVDVPAGKLRFQVESIVYPL